MDEKKTTNWVMIGITAVAVLLLCGAFSVVSFAVGRASAEPELLTETITELIEVTREVPVEVPVEIEVTVIATAVPGQEAPAQPTAVPTDALDSQPLTDAANIDLSVFNEAWDIIEKDFDGELPPEEEVLYAIIGGSLETLDDNYTRYIRPDVAARLREDMGGSVEGIGAFVRENDDGIVEIVRPIAGQPAEKAGLRAGDLIIGVDGEDVIGMSLDEILPLVRGPRGTEVVLTIFRPKTGEELEVPIIRVRFEVPIIESKMLDDGIGYIHLTEFNANAAERTQEALADLQAQGATRIIFDLRDNPGGYLDQSVAIGDLFLPGGVVLYERNNQGLEKEFTADAGDAGEDIPLVVLVNAGSASASEIVAGALRDNGRAILIGETTFGKGSVQQIHQLSDGSELRVTIARWYTPANVSISDEGITPDIEVVSPDVFTLGGEGDTQLERAIEYLKNQE
jgi:carboxyl-terminal processing protease